MKVRVPLLAALGVALVAGACSSKPESHPATETTGGNGPAGGGGGGNGGGDGGASSSSGGSTSSGGGGVDAGGVGVDSGSCLGGSCLGCCSATNVCWPGDQPTLCGLNGQLCQNCTQVGGQGICEGQVCQ